MIELGLLTGVITLIDTLIVSFASKNQNQKVYYDIQDVRRWLETMRAYLNDTEGREGNEGLKVRVQQVRELACETEEAIEEYMLQVPQHIHHQTVTKTFHAIHYRSPIKQLSSNMEKIKAKMNDIKDLEALCAVAAASSSGARDVPPEDYPKNPSDDDLVGIEKRRETLLNLVLSDGPGPKTLVVSVFGDAGSGKTTLINEAYEMVKGSFQCHAWIPVPHSDQRLQEMICEALPVSKGQDNRWSLRSYLQEKRYILVLDGIWSENEWNYIRSLIPFNNEGSKIIISTRKRNLASHCATSSKYIYDLSLSPLTWGEAWELFCKKAFQSDHECPQQLQEWSKKIVSRCEGLPHAIVAVGSYLSKKRQEVSLFKNVHDDGIEYEPGSHSYYGKILQTYYCLSPNLKSCFLYFCNFPEDCLVTHGRLVHLWIAEGFIEDRRGSSKTLEEVADEYLDELDQMRLVQVSRCDFDGRIKSVRVSNFVRGFIISKTVNDMLFTILRKGNTSLDARTRCLSLHNCFPDMSKSKDLLSCVRTSFMFGVDSSSEPIARQLLSNFSLLRVLDLENAALKSFPDVVVKLTLLRYLSLRNTRIDSVPKSIKKLLNLVILDLRQTLVTKLPKKIIELQKLLYLLVDCRDRNHANAGVEVSPGIECLTFLQKLSLIKANKKKKKKQGIVKGLAKLVNLRKLGITELRREDGKDLCESIEKMENLSSLHITSVAGKEDYLDLTHVTKCPQLLKRLFLGGRLENIPKWIISLSTLFKIELKWSKMENSPLEALGALPSLKELRLCDAYSGEKLVFEAEWFKELRTLEIEQCSRLHTVVIQEQSMSTLRKLTIRECNSLSNVELTTTFLSHMEETIIPQDLTRILDS